jgi:DNA-binding transcriptional MocR family regulator
LVISLGRELGPFVELLGDEAGMHVAVTLQNRSCNLEIAERAAALNLSLWPLSPSYMGEASRQGFILGFGCTRLTEIPNAVRKLRNLFAMNVVMIKLC